MNNGIPFLAVVCCGWPLLVHVLLNWIARVPWSQINWREIDWSQIIQWRNND